MTDVLFLNEKITWPKHYSKDEKHKNDSTRAKLTDGKQKALDQNANKRLKRKHEPGDEGVKVIDSLGMFWLVRSKPNTLLVDKP